MFAFKLFFQIHELRTYMCLCIVDTYVLSLYIIPEQILFKLNDSHVVRKGI